MTATVVAAQGRAAASRTGKFSPTFDKNASTAERAFSSRPHITRFTDRDGYSMCGAPRI